MKQFVTDTHPLIWALTNDRRLSSAAKAIFLDADNGLAQVIIPPIVIVEMIYLSEKGRIATTLVWDLLADIMDPDSNLHLGDLDAPVIKAVGLIPRNLIPEMPDRIIAATAIALNVSLITKDSQIIDSGKVNVIW